MSLLVFEFSVSRKVHSPETVLSFVVHPCLSLRIFCSARSTRSRVEGTCEEEVTITGAEKLDGGCDSHKTNFPLFGSFPGAQTLTLTTRSTHAGPFFSSIIVHTHRTLSMSFSSATLNLQLRLLSCSDYRAEVGHPHSHILTLYGLILFHGSVHLSIQQPFGLGFGFEFGSRASHHTPTPMPASISIILPNNHSLFFKELQ